MTVRSGMGLRFACVVLGLLAMSISPSLANITYQIEDGSSEFTVGIDPGEDMIWINTFPVQAGGEIIRSINATFGRPGLGQSHDGLVVSALLYQDSNGGSPLDAVLLQEALGTVSGSNTDTFNEFAISPTLVEGDMAVAILFRNTTAQARFIASLDRTAPTLAGRSYIGFDVGLDPADLDSIPGGQFGTIEGFGINGNFLVRAEGQPIPEPSSIALLTAAIVSALAPCLQGLSFRSHSRVPTPPSRPDRP